MNIRKVSETVQFNDEKMQKINLFESARMFCDIYCLKPGQLQKIHTHEGSDKIYYVIEGKGSFTVGQETRILQSGDITCAQSGERHGVENSSETPLICLVFMAPHPRFGGDQKEKVS